MEKSSLLILGGGGYIEAVVLPTLKKHFPEINISVMFKNPLKSLKICEKFQVHAGENLEGFSHYFLAVPPSDYGYYLRKTSSNSRVWIEKPLCSIGWGDYQAIESLLLPEIDRFFIGYNKRQILSTFQIPENFTRIKLGLNVREEKGNWKEYLLPGGMKWVDGCHLFDLAYQLFKGKLIANWIQKSNTAWKIELLQGNQTIEISVGQDCDTEMWVDGKEIDLFSPLASLLFFKKAFGEFLEGRSNALDSLENTQKTIRLFSS